MNPKPPLRRGSNRRAHHNAWHKKPNFHFATGEDAGKNNTQNSEFVIRTRGVSRYLRARMLLSHTVVTLSRARKPSVSRDPRTLTILMLASSLPPAHTVAPAHLPYSMLLVAEGLDAHSRETPELLWSDLPRCRLEQSGGTPEDSDSAAALEKHCALCCCAHLRILPGALRITCPTCNCLKLEVP